MTSSSLPAISTLEADLKGSVVLPTSPSYASAISRWAINTSRPASAVVYPKDASDISLTLAFARSNNLSIAVKCGGHNLAGSSSIEGGLVIDLSKHLNEVRIDQNEKLAYVGGGSIWETVDKEAIKYGLATVGGTVNNTGVGGFTLGGGYGFLTASYGLAIDNLVSATIVLSNGDVVTASSSSHPDLFWAIRGGGGNFGIVTEFVFRLHEQRPNVYFGMLIYSPDKAEELGRVTREWWKGVGEKDSMMQIAGTGPDNKAAIILVPFYNGSEEEGRKNYQAFLDIGPLVDKTGEVPYGEVNGLLRFVAPPGAGVYTKGVSFPPLSDSLFSKAFARVLEISQAPASKYGGIKVKLMFDYHSTNKVRTVPNDATAFRRDALVDENGESMVSSVLHLSWPGETDGERVNFEGKDCSKTEVARALAKELGELLTDGTLATNPSYANYDGDANYTIGHETIYDKTRVKFGENYGRLQVVKRKYDPENVFNRWFAIEPLV